MPTSLRPVAFDVHAAAIAVAVAESGGEVRSVSVIPNRAEAVAKLLRKLDRASGSGLVRAGAHGVRELLAAHESRHRLRGNRAVACAHEGRRPRHDQSAGRGRARAVGPGGGDLTPVYVPDAAHEVLCDLVRAREAAEQDQLRARHRLSELFVRHGVVRPAGMAAWGPVSHLAAGAALRARHAPGDLPRLLLEVEHLRQCELALEQAIEAAVTDAPPAMWVTIGALQTLRGVRLIVAATIVREVSGKSYLRLRQLAGHMMEYSGQRAVPGPELKAPMTPLIRRTVVGQIVPRGAGLHHPEHAVEHVVRITARTVEPVGASMWLGEQRFEPLPLGFGEVHTASSRRTNGNRLPRGRTTAPRHYSFTR